MAGQLGPHPGELRRVDRGHLDHGDVDGGLVVQQLAAQRGGEPVDGVLGAAVGGLQRDAALPQRRPDLHDRPAIARPHPGQRRHRAVHEAQVGHLGDPAELLRGDLGERGEHRGEGHVDPDIDGSEGVLYLLRGRIHLGEIGDVRRDGERPAARPLHVARRAFQARLTARDQPDAVPALGELPGRGPADARARSGDGNSGSHVPSFAVRAATSQSGTGDGAAPVDRTARGDCGRRRLRRRSRWRSSGVVPPQIPYVRSWVCANSRHSRLTRHPAQIVLARAICLSAGPFAEIGKKRSGSADRHAPAARQLAALPVAVITVLTRV